jgi:lipooligosaccharide transport system ATP-binding protein
MSHDMEEVETLCDHVLIMETGRFVVNGAPHELIQRFCHPALLDIVVDDALSFDWARLFADDDPRPRQTARGVVVEVRDPTASMERLRASSIEFTSATVRPSSLTDVFLRVTGHEAD